MSQPHLCFYSARCRYSQTFLEELARTPYSKEFRFICVDQQPGQARAQLPPYVKAVPTLMIAGEREPRVDENVMNWLAERRLRERSAAAPGGAGGVIGGTGDGMLYDGGPMAYTGTDFSLGGNEGYSFIGEEPTSLGSGSMVRMFGNMAPVNEYSMSPSSAAPVPANIMAASAQPQISEKARALNSQLEAFQKARDMDLPGPPQRR